MTKKYLFLNSRDELFRMDVSKIVYFEADGNYTRFVLSDKVKGSVCMNLSEMQKLLTDSLKESASIFARVGKRHIVNLTYVYQISVLRQKLVLHAHLVHYISHHRGVEIFFHHLKNLLIRA